MILKTNLTQSRIILRNTNSEAGSNNCVIPSDYSKNRFAYKAN